MASALVAGCGGDDDDGSAVPSSQPDDGPTSSPSAGDSGGASDECPWTAEQVSDVVGAPVEQLGSMCQYAAADGSLTPNAIFNPITPDIEAAVCDEHSDEYPYEETVEGLGVEAYLHIGGTQILVCGADSFEVRTDLIDPEASLAATTELVRLVLAGR